MLALTMLTPPTMHPHQYTSALPPTTAQHPTKRPKLSLLTTGVSKPLTFGKSSTSLSIPAASSSPTLLNTFSNAYDPSPALPAPAAARTLCPYTLPYGHRSILRNGPIPVRQTPRSARRQRFPRMKRVKYTTPLVETIPVVPRSATEGEEEEEKQEQDIGAAEEQVRANARRVDGLRKVSGRRARGRHGEGPTPIYGPRQKREWTWTLGPDNTEAAAEEEEAEVEPPLLRPRTSSSSPPHPASVPAVSARTAAGAEATRSPRARPYPPRRRSSITTSSSPSSSSSSSSSSSPPRPRRSSR